ncbi:hypothetical protein M747DRAFT_39623 [Aspergillus niger ATCC 13496]|uniref:Zn(2)-C6 fungal-type domain-containing protein n=1 Tax=Aspergillus niger ATCC 13496 TaxID=1353008 RepID=A0A370BYQ6_ASPNG|nr:hypothetical protein M747DRAFT_39623 [Aspergillus niger ATCC 13496]
MIMMEKVSLRSLHPTREALQTEPTYSKPATRRQNLACTACRRKRRNCTGAPLCQFCVASNSVCVFEPHKDKRRKMALRHAEGTKQRLEDFLKRLLIFLASKSDEAILKWRKCLGSAQSPETILESLKVAMAEVPNLVNSDRT